MYPCSAVQTFAAKRHNAPHLWNKCWKTNKPLTDLVVFLACVCVCKEYCLRNDVTSARKKGIPFFPAVRLFIYDDWSLDDSWKWGDSISRKDITWFKINWKWQKSTPLAWLFGRNFKTSKGVYTGGGGVLPYMGYIGMCRCEEYGFQAVYSRIGYINQNIWV